MVAAVEGRTGALDVAWVMARMLTAIEDPDAVTRSSRASQAEVVLSRHSPETRYYGVSWNAEVKRWKCTYTNRKGQTTYIGLFDDQVEAALAYNATATRRVGKG